MEKVGDVMTSMKHRISVLAIGRGLVLTVMLLTALHPASAQLFPPFNSGSDGSDGALNLTTAGTYIFDPNDTVLFGKVLDPDGNGIFNFTTINIASGVTLKFRGDRYNRPVFWLASGAVTINGILDLEGAAMLNVTVGDLDGRRKLPVPGSGGFSGGAPGWSTSVPATAGDGPGGGSTSGINCNPLCGVGGTFAGSNRYLVPLIGGSGGGGSTITSGSAESGAAGGGAILISSSASISVTNGFILANGGVSASSQRGGAGSGGAIRLLAPTISTNTTNRFQVSGAGPGDSRSSSNGVVRLEAFQFFYGRGLTTTPSMMVYPLFSASSGFPIDSYLSPSSVRIVSIDGIQVGNTPSGSFFKTPDITINKTVAVPIVVQAAGIPASTPVLVKVFSDNPSDPQTVSTTYNATLDNSLHASVNVQFPFGLSRCYIQVTWVQ